MYVLEYELFMRSREDYFGVIHQNNTRMSAYTVRHEITFIILFLARQKASINYDKNDDIHIDPCFTRSLCIILMTSQSIADDVTMARQLWRDHVINDI